MSDNRKANPRRLKRSHSWSHPSTPQQSQSLGTNRRYRSMELGPQSPAFTSSIHPFHRFQPRTQPPGSGQAVVSDITGSTSASEEQSRDRSPLVQSSPEPEPSVRPKTYRIQPRSSERSRRRRSDSTYDPTSRSSSFTSSLEADPFLETPSLDPFSFGSPYVSDEPFGQSLDPFSSLPSTRRRHSAGQLDQQTDLPSLSPLRTPYPTPTPTPTTPGRYQWPFPSEQRRRQSEPYYPPPEMDWTHQQSTYNPDHLYVRVFKDKQESGPDFKRWREATPNVPPDQPTRAQEPTEYAKALADRSRRRTKMIIESDSYTTKKDLLLRDKKFKRQKITTGPKPTDFIYRYTKPLDTTQYRETRTPVQPSRPEPEDRSRFERLPSQMRQRPGRPDFMPVGRQSLGPVGITRSQSMPNLGDIDIEEEEVAQEAPGFRPREQAFLTRIGHLDPLDLAIYKKYQLDVNLSHPSNQPLAKRLTPRPTEYSLQEAGQSRVKAIKKQTKDQVKESQDLAQRQSKVKSRAELKSTLDKKFKDFTLSPIVETGEEEEEMEEAEEAGEGEVKEEEEVKEEQKEDKPKKKKKNMRRRRRRH